MGYLKQALLAVRTHLSGTLATAGGVDEYDGSESVPYEELFERSADGHILLDADGTVVEANSAARELLASRPVTPGKELSTILPAVAALDSADGHEWTEVTVDAGRHRRHLKLRRVPLSASQGPQHLLTLRDVTDDRRAEKRYREFVEHTSDLVLVLDADGTITFAGPSWEPLLGKDPAGLVGTELATVIHPDDRESFRAAFETVLETPTGSRRFGYRIQDRDDDWRFLDGVGQNLLDDAVVDGVLLTSRDVTERREREHDLQRQNERLEEFASVLSHDLRSPLQVATLSLDRARREGSEEAFEKAEQAHERIDTIIGDVLTLARQGQAIDETTDVSLDDVARAAWETVDTRSMTLTVAAGSHIEADPDRLQQLFENLFRNALEHAGPDTSVTVGALEPMHTSTRIDVERGNGFYVGDDGPGIPERQQDKVLDSGFSTAADGTGFGLAIVEQIADAHRWEMTVTDSRDGGARFEFTERTTDSYLGSA